MHQSLTNILKEYQKQIIVNSSAMADEFIKLGYKIVSNGTDNHLFTLILTGTGINGLEAETLLHSCNITLNKNAIPHDPLPPFKASGLRIGSPAMTTRGFKENEMRLTARIIDKILKNKDNLKVLDEARREVLELLKKYPLPY